LLPTYPDIIVRSIAVFEALLEAAAAACLGVLVLAA
jgi:hypothetical protein